MERGNAIEVAGEHSVLHVGKSLIRNNRIGIHCCNGVKSMIGYSNIIENCTMSGMLFENNIDMP